MAEERSAVRHTPGSGSDPGSPRGAGSGTVGSLVAIVALAAGLLAVGIGIGTWGMRAVLAPTASGAPAATSAALTSPRGDGWEAWGARADGTPLRWDPCTPVEWVVRPSDPAWLPDVAGRALDEVGAAAGIDLEFVGTRDVAIGDEAATTAGDRWAPVVVTFATPREVAWLTDDDRALAVPVQVEDVFVTGQVLLNANTTLAADFSSRDGSWGATLLHEAGHLVGLDHVADPAQLLHPFPGPGEAALADGDLRGLAALRGDGECLPTTPVDLDVPTPRRRSAEGGSHP